MASTKGSQLLGVLSLCLIVLLVIIILILINANDSFFLNAITDTIFNAFHVTPGSFGGWLVMLIVAGIVLIAVMGTFSLVKYAINLFKA
jgi:hypothetical protein